MKIISVVTNNPTFIEIQYKSIHKFFKCKESLEIIIFNDAKSWNDITNFGDTTMPQQIMDMCTKLNITCINIPNQQHKNSTGASHRHADSMNFMTNYMKMNPDMYFVLDCDMFFVDYFDMSVYEKYYFYYVLQGRSVHYPWPNIFFIDTRRVPNVELIDWSLASGTDTGGKCAKWLSLLETEKTYKLKPHLSSGKWTSSDLPKNINKNIYLFLDNDVRNEGNKYFSEIFDEKIFHYRAGSNWTNKTRDVHDKMTQLLNSTFDKIIQES